MRDDVKVEGGIDVGDSGGHGESAVVEGEDGGQGFDGSGSSNGVAVQGLGGADRDGGGEGAEELVDGGGLGCVVGLGSGAVGVNVADLGGSSAGRDASGESETGASVPASVSVPASASMLSASAARIAEAAPTTNGNANDAAPMKIRTAQATI